MEFNLESKQDFLSFKKQRVATSRQERLVAKAVEMQRQLDEWNDMSVDKRQSIIDFQKWIDQKDNALPPDALF